MARLNVKVVPGSSRDQIVGGLKAQSGFPISLQHREHRLSSHAGSEPIKRTTPIAELLGVRHGKMHPKRHL
jgi:hypothetical protein